MNQIKKLILSLISIKDFYDKNENFHLNKIILFLISFNIFQLINHFQVEGIMIFHNQYIIQSINNISQCFKNLQGQEFYDEKIILNIYYPQIRAAYESLDQCKRQNYQGKLNQTMFILTIGSKFQFKSLLLTHVNKFELLLNYLINIGLFKQQKKVYQL
ncbi:hypothetical protein pb186bvf_018784 [Paramecium bursaria]